MPIVNPTTGQAALPGNPDPTGSPATGNASVPINTNVDWATLVLNDLGAPIDSGTITAVLDWMTHENGSGTWTGTAGANNPLNDGLGSGGGDGTGSYPDLTTAAAYAAASLKGGVTGATPAGNDLIADNPSQFVTDIKNSSWASSHYPSWTGLFGGVPTVTWQQSGASGATGPVTPGDGSVQSHPNPTGANGSPSGGPSSPTSTKGVSTDQLGGAGNILQSLDHLMNPSGGNLITQITTLGVSDIASSIEGLVVRVLFAGVFAYVFSKGLKMFTDGSVSMPSVPNPFQDTSDPIANRQAAQQASNERIAQQKHVTETIKVQGSKDQLAAKQSHEAKQGSLKRRHETKLDKAKTARKGGGSAAGKSLIKEGESAAVDAAKVAAG